MPSNSNRSKLVFGLILSAVFMWLAFRKVDFREMGKAFAMAHYVYFVPAVLIMFVSHWLRAFRWRYLLDPIRRVATFDLFSPLLIGYMANSILPAHLGEFVRAFVLSKKRDLSMSTTFATIVVERVIDVLSLLLLMVLTMFLYPFPQEYAWVKESGIILFAVALGLFLFLLLLKRNTANTLRAVRFSVKDLAFDAPLRLLPRKVRTRLKAAMEPGLEISLRKLEAALRGFVDGIVPLRRRGDYLTVFVLSVLIWACYGGTFLFSFYAFEFVGTYHLPWTASLVLLVITTVSIVVPSSPGYVGTYHLLCKLSLVMLGVPPDPALSYAFAVHGVSFLPVLAVGLVFARREGVAISRMSEARSRAQRGGNIP